MIAFISIFFGLVVGVHPIELAVSGAVTEIEVRLDGEVVGVLREEPWIVECDFGSELAIHELVAVARGPAGAELDRAVQRINIPRPHVDAQVLLDDWRAGRPRTARLIWQSVEPIQPTAVSVVLDGEVLANSYAERYDLPDLDPKSVHFLSARLEFSDQLYSSAEVVFGGVYGDSAEAELTAIPLIVDDRKLRRPERLQGLLEKDGKALRIVAVEHGPAEVVIVRDHEAISRLALLGLASDVQGYSHSSTSLAKGDSVLLISARAYLAGNRYAVFPLSPPMTRNDASLTSILANLEFSRSLVLPQQLTDAVATAGLRAAASHKRRAVVLVVSDCADVSGQWSPQVVRRFLAQLRVPFRIWRVERQKVGAAAPVAGSFCDGAQPSHDTWRYYAAIKRLRRDLKGQQIAWVEGRHLPHEITLTGDEPGVRLAE